MTLFTRLRGRVRNAECEARRGRRPWERGRSREESRPVPMMVCGSDRRPFGIDGVDHNRATSNASRRRQNPPGDLEVPERRAGGITALPRPLDTDDHGAVVTRPERHAHRRLPGGEPRIDDADRDDRIPVSSRVSGAPRVTGYGHGGRRHGDLGSDGDFGPGLVVEREPAEGVGRARPGDAPVRTAAFSKAIVVPSADNANRSSGVVCVIQ